MHLQKSFEPIVGDYDIIICLKNFVKTRADETFFTDMTFTNLIL